MTLATDVTRNGDIEQYQQLENGMPSIESQVQRWFDAATVLHGELTDPTEQAEVVALRDTLVANLRIILGV